MKIIGIFLALTVIYASLGVYGFAQDGGSDGGDIYQLGNKQIVIPPPQGFVEAASQIPIIRERLDGGAAGGNDFLAAHVPAEHFQRLKKGELFDLTFYTKVTVSKKLKTFNAAEADFALFVDTFKKSFPALSDPNSKEMKAVLKSVSENLSNLNKTETTLTLSQPLTVGSIEDSRNAYGIVILFQVKAIIGGKEIVRTLVNGISAVRVKEKIIFIYTYKAYEKEPDIAALQQFSKQWLNRIIAANSNAK
ncbi:MAG TPA: hypothetical protein VF599_01645 [Pyrinomonadaceae bacterium]|jgi:hypothetical protein